MTVRDTNKLDLWYAFCAEHNILQRSAPLFEVSSGIVKMREYGLDKRLVLQRSAKMESTVIEEANKVIRDFEDLTESYEGLIYMMFWTESEVVLPLYIGKTEKIGRGGGNLSANIENIRTNMAKFARWGYNYDYHFGDLSREVCPGHTKLSLGAHSKYAKWAQRLFVSYPTTEPQLCRDTRFWVEAWQKGRSGIWREYGETSLTFLEYLLIGVASDLFPDTLLNSEGVNRK